MKVSLQQIIASLASLLFAVLIAFYIDENPARIGEQPLVIRALLSSIAVVALLYAAYPIHIFIGGMPVTYVLIVCLPALALVFIFYLIILPIKAGSGFSAEQLASTLISDRSSNGIIEVGFRYPIFTPTILVRNSELFTRSANVFLRMEDENGESNLFRAVRAHVPGNNLSVEYAVQGMLSQNDEYLFNPLIVAPNQTLSGQVVFIISNVEDGETFTEALSGSYRAQFELRDLENGRLLLEFPLQHN